MVELLVVLLLDVHRVEGLVDRLEVVYLHLLEVLLDEGELALHQHRDPRVVEQAVLLGQVADEVVELKGGRLQVKGDGLVQVFGVGALEEELPELRVLPSLVRVVHHGEGGVVGLVIVHVEEAEGGPELVLLARADDAGDVHAAEVELEVLHQLLHLVLGIQDREFRVDARRVAPHLHPQPALHHANQLLEVAPALVDLDELLDLVGDVHQVQAAHLRQPELLRLDASHQHLLPGAGEVGLARGLHRVRVLLQADEARGELVVLADGGEEHARGLEHALVGALLADVLDVCEVGGGDKLLQLRHLPAERVAHHHGRVDDAAGLLRAEVLLARHLQEADERVVLLGGVGALDHPRVLRRVVGLDVRVNAVRHLALVQLRLGERGPHGLDVALRGVVLGPVKVTEVVDEDRDGLGLVVKLLVDDEGLLKEALADADGRDVEAVELVEAVDVLHDAPLVLLGEVPRTRHLHGREDEQVLEVLVGGKLRVLPEDNLLEQLDELVGQVGRHERLDRARDGLAVLALGERRGHDLVHEGPLVLVLVRQHLAPELQVLPLHQELGLRLKQSVLVGDVDRLVVARAPRRRVDDKGEVGVALLAVGPHDLVVVVLVLLEKLLGRLVGVDVDHGQGVVQRGVLLALVEPRLEPGEEEAEPVALDARGHEGLDGAHVADAHDQRADLRLLAARVDERPHHLRGPEGVDLLHVDLDVLHHALAVEVVGELLHHVVLVADVDQGAGVHQLGLRLEKVLDLLGGVVLRLARDPLKLLEVVLHQPDTRASHDVLVVHALVLGEVDNGAKVVVKALHALVLLKELDQGRRGHKLRVLCGNLDADLQVLPEVLCQHLPEELNGPGDVQVPEPLEHEVALHLPAVDNDALEVLELRIVLKGALV
mmetsp:Transcript_27243/g.69170  ORF Transcript_27243/g.69170 Transcript_27243/m.69170 type:complete len:886 (-) Transcript_27243:1919-4576(-)